MNKYNEAYIKYCKSDGDLKEIVDGLWQELSQEVDYYLSENSLLSVEQACEAVIEDTYWSPFHLHVFAEAVYRERNKIGSFWHHFIEDFEDFMQNEASKVLLKTWQKKYGGR